MGNNNRNYTASGNRGGYSRNNQSSGRNNDSYSYDGNRNRSSTGKKHSGCKVGIISKGNNEGSTYVQGWNASKRHGMMSFLATPYSKSAVHKSAAGREWVNVMVVVSKEREKDFIVSGLMDMSTKKVIVKELGMVMNPKAPNGGYCGRY